MENQPRESEAYDYTYNPISDDYSGYGPERYMLTEDSPMKYFVVDTTRVGVDGLREALIQKYGLKKEQPEE